MDDLISRQAAIKTAKNVAYYVDEHGSANGWLAMLVNWLEILPSAQPEQIARDIATIIENEKDMRVILQNAERTETHSCDYQRTETHESCTDCPLYDHDRHNCPRFNKVIPTVLDTQPRWISVTEALPRDDEDVIVTCLDDSGDTPYSYTTVAWHYKGMWVCDNERCPFVIAWMPMPDSYKEEQDG